MRLRSRAIRRRSPVNPCAAFQPGYDETMVALTMLTSDRRDAGASGSSFLMFRVDADPAE